MRILMFVASLLVSQILFAQTTTQMTYTGRLYDSAGLPATGLNFKTRVDIRSDVNCFILRTDADATSDSDGNFAATIRLGLPGQVFAGHTDLQNMLGTTFNGNVTCRYEDATLNGTFNPSVSSNQTREVRILVSFDNGANWELVDVQTLNPYYQAQDSERLAGKLPSAYMTTGTVSQSSLDSFFSGSNFSALQTFSNGGTLATSAQPVSPNDVVNKDYSDSNIAGSDVDLSGIANGSVLSWDGTKWIATSSSTIDNTKLPLTGGTLSGDLLGTNAIMSGSLAVSSVYGPQHITMGGNGHFLLSNRPSDPSLDASYTGALWYNTTWNRIQMRTAGGTVGILTDAVVLNDISGTLGFSKGGLGISTYTPYGLLAVNMTGSALEQHTCSAGQSLVWSAGGGWTCATAGVGTVTNIGLNASNIFLNSNLPITSTGTFDLQLAPQSQHLVLAAPTSATGTPTFRQLAASDLPLIAGTGVTFATSNGSLSISAIGGTGTTSQWSDNTRGIHYSTGSVGIGTNVPSAMLDVNGEIASAGLIRGQQFMASTAGAGTQNSALEFYQSSAAANAKVWDIYQTGSELSIRALDDGFASPMSAMIFNRTGTNINNTRFPNGNVGIGSSVPVVALDVSATGTRSAIRIPRDTAASRPTGASASELVGMMRYNTDSNKYEVYETSGWTSLSTGTASVSQWETTAGGQIVAVGKTVAINKASNSEPVGALDVTGDLYLNGFMAMGPQGSPYSYISSSNVSGSALTTFTGNLGAAEWNYQTGSRPAVKIGAIGHETAIAIYGTSSTAFADPPAIKLSSDSANSYIRYGQFGIGNDAPTAMLDVGSNGTLGSAIRIPQDTTARRPTNSYLGMMRYNTSDHKYEVYETTGWASLKTSTGTAGVTQWVNGTAGISYNAGNVAIGIAAAPGGANAAELTVGSTTGDATLDVTSYGPSATNAGIFLQSHNGTSQNDSLGIFQNVGNDLVVAFNGNPRMQLSRTGGLTLSNPSNSTLSIESTTAGLARINLTSRTSGTASVATIGVDSYGALVSRHSNDVRMAFSKNAQFGVANPTTASSAVYPAVTVSNYSNGTTGYPTFILNNARGSESSVANVANGDVLGTLQFNGYGNGNGFYEGGAIAVNAVADWTGANRSSEMRFYTGGTSGSVRRMTITSSGSIGINTDTPNHLLTVNGTAAVGALCIGADCRTSWSGGGTTEWLTAPSGGIYTAQRVGIGTAPSNSPVNQLTVRTTANEQASIFVEAAGSNSQNAGITFTSNNSGNPNTPVSIFQTIEGYINMSFGSAVRFAMMPNGSTSFSHPTSPMLEVATTSAGTAGIRLTSITSGTAYRATYRVNGSGDLVTSVGQTNTIVNQTGQFRLVTSNTGISPLMTVANYSASDTPGLDFTNYQGTQDIPAAIGANRVLGQINFAGGYGTTYATRPGAAIYGRSTTAWDNTSSPGELIFATSANTGTSARMIVKSDGRIGMGTETPTAGAGLDLNFTGTSASSLLLPRDSTTNRPTAVNGMMRYNNTDNRFEVVQGGAWTQLATGTMGVSSQWTTSGSDIHYAPGRVAIGTTGFAVGANLTIGGTGAPAISIGPSADADANSTIYLQARSASTTYQARIEADNTGNIAIRSPDAGRTRIGTYSGDSRLIVYNDTGRVAVGFTALPNWQLDVNGGIGFSGTLGVGTVPVLVRKNTSSIALGDSAAANSTGISNTVIGAGAMSGASGISGTRNTIVGSSAGEGLTTGSRNTLLGTGAGSSLATGSDNIFIGNLAGQGISTTANNIIISNAAGTYSNIANQLDIGGVITGNIGSVSTQYVALSPTGTTGVYVGANGRVGINTTSLSSGALTVNGQITSVLGSVNTPTYSFAGDPDTGVYSTGANTVAIGVGATEKIAITAGSTSISGPVFLLGNLTASTGTITAVSFTSTSDERLKKDIHTMPGLDAVRKLRGVSYKWRSTGDGDAGVIAQEVEQAFPNAVRTDASGFKSVKYNYLIAPLIEAVKELDVRCESRTSNLEARINELEAENSKLKQNQDALELRLLRLERAAGITQ